MAHKCQPTTIMLTTKWVSPTPPQDIQYVAPTTKCFLGLHSTQHVIKAMIISTLITVVSFQSTAGFNQPGPPGRHLGHYPSMPPGYQNTPAPHAAPPMHPGLHAPTQPYTQAPQPYQQVRGKSPPWTDRFVFSFAVFSFDMHVYLDAKFFCLYWLHGMVTLIQCTDLL